MGDTNIKPFANDTDNVSSDEYYETLREAGHVPGIALSAFANKLGKQVTAITAGLADFVAGILPEGYHVDDTLTPSQMAAYIFSAIRDSLPDASTVVRGFTKFADDSESAAGTIETKALTPKGLLQRTATLTRVGVVELATSTGVGSANEVVYGTNDTRAVTPLGLARKVASESAAGIAEIATTGEVTAGSDATRIVTPAGLNSFAKSVTEDGYTKLPGGVIIQWGRETNDWASHDFPIAFPTACFSITATADSPATLTGGPLYLYTLSKTAFAVKAGASPNPGSCNIKWIAIGH